MPHKKACACPAGSLRMYCVQCRESHNIPKSEVKVITRKNPRNHTMVKIAKGKDKQGHDVYRIMSADGVKDLKKKK